MGKCKLALGVGVLVLSAVGCGGKSKANQDAGPESVTVTVGKEGGDVEGPSGVGLSIPPGALDEDVEITISVPTSGYEALPAVADSAVFAFEPHGLQFNLPVEISIPHTSVPEEIAMYTSSLGGEWSRLDAARGATELRAQVDHFSFFFNIRDVCGLYRQECCVGVNAPDGACAGDSLTCVDNRCLECGFEGERCCGSTCHAVMADGFDLACASDGYCSYPYPDAGFVDAGYVEPDAPPSMETMTVTFTSAPVGQVVDYAPANIVATWIEDAGGNFVQTIDRQAAVRVDSLVAWRAKSGANDTDAVTGATRPNHSSPVSATWDIPPGTPAGVYTIRVEVCDGNSTTSAENNQGNFTFDLNNVQSTQNGLTGPGLTDVSIDYSGS